MVGHLRSKSTQPNHPTRWTTLYILMAAPWWWCRCRAPWWSRAAPSARTRPPSAPAPPAIPSLSCSRSGCRVCCPARRWASWSKFVLKAELIGSLKLVNVWIFVQLIPRPKGTKNQLYKDQTLPDSILLIIYDCKVIGLALLLININDIKSPLMKFIRP